MRLVLNTRPRQHTQRGPPPHTPLQLLRNTPLILREELARKSALAAQRRRPNLQTRLVLQVIVFDFKFQMIPRVDHFVRHGVFLVASIAEFIGAEEDSVAETESSGLFVCTYSAQNVVVV